MIPGTQLLRQVPDWQTALGQAITDPAELLELLGLGLEWLPAARDAARVFPLGGPRGFGARMRRGGPAGHVPGRRRRDDQEGGDEEDPATPTRIRGIASARLKETDRVSATCHELRRLGVEVDEHEDGMTIYPCKRFKRSNVQTYNDHRMAMSFSLIGLRVPGVVIENPSCVSKTFPNYFEVLDLLR